MSRLIDADVLKQHIDKLPALPDGNFAGNHSALKALINMQPTIEERKNGKWIPQDFNKSDGMITTAVYYYPKCSVCGWSANNTNFCPNCGADMRGEQDDSV